jgi:hypothetical protein
MDGLGRVVATDNLDLRPDEVTCAEYNDVMMWGGIFSFSQGTIFEAPDGSTDRSRVWTEMRTGDGEYKLISTASGGGNYNSKFRTSWRPKQSHPDGPLW